MADNTYIVVARLQFHDNKVEEVKRGLINLAHLTQQEPGCRSYELHQSSDDESTFLIYEEWESTDDLDKHMNSRHFKTWQEKSSGWEAKPVEATFWKKIS
ncbi:MAG: putative quinol monooxygenase [Dehalococcoidia bacterium]